MSQAGTKTMSGNGWIEGAIGAAMAAILAAFHVAFRQGIQERRVSDAERRITELEIARKELTEIGKAVARMEVALQTRTVCEACHLRLGKHS